MLWTIIDYSVRLIYIDHYNPIIRYPSLQHEVSKICRVMCKMTQGYGTKNSALTYEAGVMIKLPQVRRYLGTTPSLFVRFVFMISFLCWSVDFINLKAIHPKKA